MKPIFILSVLLFASIVVAGPLNFRNEAALREHQAKQAYEASANYYSPEQFAADAASAKNFSELQAAMLKKARADQAEAKAKKDSKVNVSIKSKM